MYNLSGPLHYKWISLKQITLKRNCLSGIYKFLLLFLLIVRKKKIADQLQ